MKRYKVVFRERDKFKKWRTVTRIITADSKEHALIKTDRHLSLIKKIEFLGYKTKEIYKENSINIKRNKYEF